MQNDLLLSFISVIAGLLLAYFAKKSIASIMIIAASFFVLSLSMVRWFFVENGGAVVEGKSVAVYFIFILFMAGGAASALFFKNFGAVSLEFVGWMRMAGLQEYYYKYSAIILMFAWVVRIYRAVVYGILFSGSGNEEAILGLDYYFVVIYSLAGMLSMGAFYCLCVVGEKFGNTAKIFIILEIMWALVASGRRDFLFLVAIFGFVYIFADKKLNYKSGVLGLFFAYVFVGLISPVFLQARINILNYMDSRDAVTSTYLGLVDAVGEIFSANNFSDQVLSDNLSERGDAAEFVNKIIRYDGDNDRHTLGGAIYTAISWAVPSVVLAKPPLMVEQYVQNFYGLPLIDDAVSWVSVGYADFSYFGCFVYGVLFVIFLYGLMYIGKISNNSFIYISASVQACYVAYSVEADPLLLFSAIRDLLLIMAILSIVKFSGFVKFK